MGGGGPDRGRAPRTLTERQREMLEHVVALRRVARCALRADLTPEARARLLHRLYPRAKAGPCPDLAAAVLVQEIADWAVFGEPPETPHHDPMAKAIRALHREGVASCPTCLRVLPTRSDLEHWAELDRVAYEEALVRERAPYRGVDL